MKAVRINGWFKLPQDFDGTYAEIFKHMEEYFLDNAVEEFEEITEGGVSNPIVCLEDFEKYLFSKFETLPEDRRFLGEINLIDKVEELDGV